jgi:hypothetical protein
VVDEKKSSTLWTSASEKSPFAHTPTSKYGSFAKEVPPVSTLVAHPCDETSLRGASAAAELGIIVPILVGTVARITAVAKQHGIRNASSTMGKERCQMAKNKQLKRDVTGTMAVSSKMRRKEFGKELTKLQVELTRMQTWVQATWARIIVILEGRDTAGKGGVISRITARTSPRVYRHVALPAPSDREKRQVHAQATSRISRRRARSSSSTAPGTTGPESSG